jgi:hypothetical protein
MIGRHDKYFPNHPKFVPFGKSKYPKADFAYVFASQGASCISTIDGYRWVPATKDKPYRRTKVLGMASSYAGPVTDYLNTTKIKWIYIATDPRYVDQIKPADLTNHPRLMIGAAECSVKKWTHAVKYLPYKDSKNLEYETYTDIPVKYHPVQKLNLFTPLDFKPSRVKVTRFALIANKIMELDYREKQIKKFIPKCTELYGNLQVAGFENQFVPSTDLDLIFQRVKYTLVMPLYDHGVGKKWLTFKPYEMIRLGVIPFIHPDYDQDNRFASTLDKDHEFLRVANREELETKMSYLDKNNDYRIHLLENLSKKIVGPIEIIHLTKLL